MTGGLEGSVPEEPVPSKPEADYKIGYRNPPRHTQFQKGKSGNPEGRPKKNITFEEHFREAMRKPVVINENGKRKKVTIMQAIFAQLAAKAAQGEFKAIQLFFKLAASNSHYLDDFNPMVAGKPLASYYGRAFKDMSDEELSALIEALGGDDSGLR